MPEALTLEEQRRQDTEHYVNSIIYLLTLALCTTFTSLYLLFFGILLVILWIPEKEDRWPNYFDFWIPWWMLPSTSMSLMLSYLAILNFGKGPIAWILIFMTVFSIGFGSFVIFNFEKYVDQQLWLLWTLWLLHLPTTVFFLVSIFNHRTMFDHNREFGWDEFSCMDNIVKPGLETALVNMKLKSERITDTGEVVQVDEEGKPDLAGDTIKTEMPVIWYNKFLKKDFEDGFQKTVKTYWKNRRDLNPWMRFCKYQDIMENPGGHWWSDDKVAKSLGIRSFNSRQNQSGGAGMQGQHLGGAVAPNINGNQGPGGVPGYPGQPGMTRNDQLRQELRSMQGGDQTQQSMNQMAIGAGGMQQQQQQMAISNANGGMLTNG